MSIAEKLLKGSFQAAVALVAFGAGAACIAYGVDQVKGVADIVTDKGAKVIEAAVETAATVEEIVD